MIGINSRLITLACFSLLSADLLIGQTMSSRDILVNSIEYHDPVSELANHHVELKIDQTRPDGETRYSTVFVAMESDQFAAKNVQGNDVYEMDNRKGKVQFAVNGDKNPDPELIEKYKLTKKRFEQMHKYYRYLWFAPLILNDPGANLTPEAESTFFNGKKVWEVKVTYDPSVGSDIWYFYFDQANYALKGYRFYHNELKNDGEYIILEGELEKDGIKIPASRKWYMHQDDRYLGNDILTDFELIK